MAVITPAFAASPFAPSFVDSWRSCRLRVEYRDDCEPCAFRAFWDKSEGKSSYCDFSLRMKLRIPLPPEDWRDLFSGAGMMPNRRLGNQETPTRHARYRWRLLRIHRWRRR